MIRLIRRFSPAALLLLLAACAGLGRCSAPKPLDEADFAALYAQPLAEPEAPLAVYHLGHSLVGRDMPAMLAQLAGAGHVSHSQLGWGASLKDHYEPGIEVRGFAEENAHAAHRPARAALDSGAYDALVLTEMVEIRDAIRWHDSWDYLHRWAVLGRAARPGLRVYLYETWHNLDDDEGFRQRLARDPARYWRGEILRRALAADRRPIHVIPAGTVLAAFLDLLEAEGGLGQGAGAVHSAQDLFSDTIHLNDLGSYLVALTHYAVLYHRSPEGLPHALLRADGTPATPPAPEVAAAMQRVVWQVVQSDPATGVAPRR